MRHWKLGIGAQHVQQLMCVVEAEEPNGFIMVMDRVIWPKIQAASIFPFHYASLASYCMLNCANLRLKS